MNSRRKSSEYQSSYLGLFCFSIVSGVLGVLLFANGFLLSRSELSNIAPKNQSRAPQFNRTILLLVDGLYTGLLPSRKKASFRMPFLSQILQGNNNRSYLAHFIADPPTTTMQRLKALLTGSMPTFIDAGSNFGGTELQEDNLVKQWALANKSMFFVGDQVWNELVPGHFTESFPFPSFNIKDLDTVDDAVKSYFMKTIESTNFDLLVGHMLGIDHCGHTFGRSHPEMDRKLGELDDFLKRLLPKLTAADLLVVFGDHGMTLTGDHGGDSEPELDAALLAFSQGGFAPSPSVPQMTDNELPTLEQVDLVPLLACLTGVPIPFSNLGVVQPALIRSDLLFSTVNDNYRQMVTYALEYRSRFGLITIPASIEQRWSYRSNEPCPLSDLSVCLAELCDLKTVFRSHWTRMDAPRIATGLLLVFNALLALLLYDNSICLGVCSSVILIGATLAVALAALTLPSIVYSGLAMVTTAWIVVLVVVIHAKKLATRANRGTWIVAGLLTVVVVTSCSNSFVVMEARVLAFFLQSLVVLGGLSAFLAKRCPSLAYIPLCLVLIYAGTWLEVCREESPAHSRCLNPGSEDDEGDTSLFNWFLPLASLSPRHLQRISGPRLLVAAVSIICWLGGHRLLMANWGALHVGGLVEGALRWGLPAFGCGLLILWVLDAAIAASLVGGEKSLILISATHLSFLRVNLARVLMLECFLFTGAVIRRPLLVSATASLKKTPIQNRTTAALRNFARKSNGAVDLVDEKSSEVYISGLGNVFSAWLLSALVMGPLLALLILLGDSYLLPSLGLIACLLLSPAHYLCLPGTFGCLPSRRDLFDQTRTRLGVASSWPLAVFACLLSEFGFFCLGHQTTLSAIPWGAAYSVFVGDHGTTVLPASLVLSHTFASQILVTTSLPLLVICTFRRQQLSASSQSPEVILFQSEGTLELLRGAFDRILRRYMIAHFILFIGRLLCAFVLRRHLMVWKIFAPRLIYSFCGLGVICVFVVFTQVLTIRRLHSSVMSLRQVLTTHTE